MTCHHAKPALHAGIALLWPLILCLCGSPSLWAVENAAPGGVTAVGNTQAVATDLQAASSTGSGTSGVPATEPPASAEVKAAATEIGLCPSRGKDTTEDGFGYNTFDSGGQPIAEGPIDDLYLIGPGDEIVVSIWGKLVETLNLTVSDEGFIDLPDNGGRIQTNGVTLRELKPKIAQALSQIYAAYINAVDPSKSTAFVDIRIGKLRKLSVMIVGEVNKPGTYTVSPGVANVINLLHNACGVKASGSLREIRIRRSTGKVDSVDLYGFLLTGEIDFRTIRLQQGDYIVVPLRQKSVTIEGEVRRPNRYEMIGNEGMRELLNFAGGFTPDAYLKQTQIRRFEVNRGENLLDVDLDRILTDSGQNLPLMDGDAIRIAKNIQVRKNQVSVSGDGITRPGTYEWKAGMTLNDLIQKAEGLREHAFLDRADLIRTENDFSKKLTVISLKKLYTRNTAGSFDFSGKQGDNIPLREMDEVIIQSAYGMAGKERFVVMEGHIKEPGKFVLAKDMTLYDLIFARGGFQDAAFRKATFMDTGHIFRSVPGTVGRKIIPFRLGALLDRDASANMPLEENDVIRIYAADEMRTKQQVTIDGLVNKPGAFDMVDNLTLEDLLVMAGGLRPDAARVEATIARTEKDDAQNESGTSRVTMFKVPVAKDFMSLSAEQRTRLKPDDRITIRILPGWERSHSALIQGEVMEPGNYSLLSESDRLSSLIQRAGGLKKEALPEGTIVQRKKMIVDMAASGGNSYYDIAVNVPAALQNPGGAEDIVLKPDDRIFVPTNPGVVEIRGAVHRELTVQHTPGKSLADYIAMCGGYLDKANPDAVKVFAANKVAITAKARGKSKANLDIPAGSTIEVPFLRETERMLTVEVKGAVEKPAVMQHIEGARLGYYLNLSGGFKDEADIRDISVLLPDGGLLVKSGDQPFNPVIPGGSLIMVSAKPKAGSQ